jgi:hypothetical protein
MLKGGPGKILLCPSKIFLPPNIYKKSQKNKIKNSQSLHLQHQHVTLKKKGKRKRKKKIELKLLKYQPLAPTQKTK